MTLGTKVILHGATKPSNIEQDGYEPDLFAGRIVEIPSNMQTRISYDTDNRQEYIGYGAKGLLSSADGWLIHKFTYDGNSFRITLRQSAYGIWDNRTILVFE